MIFYSYESFFYIKSKIKFGMCGENRERLKKILSNKKIGFFFGAGVSFLSGIPKLRNCETILERILCPYKNKNLPEKLGIKYEDIPAIHFFIKKASEIEEKCLSCRYPKLIIPNGSFYEDVIDLLLRNCVTDPQVYEKEGVLRPLCKNYKLEGIVKKIKYDFPSYYNKVLEDRKKLGNAKAENIDMLFPISQNVVNYIKYVFKELITISDPKDIKGYDFLLDFIKKLKNEVSVYTLNNDLVLENLFEKENLSYSVGYDKELKKFNCDFSKKIKYFKLHGSIDLFWDKSCTREHLIPFFEMGTNIKKLVYEHNLSELIGAFKSDLSQCDILFISGFGFNDVEMAKILNDFYKGENKLIVRMYEKNGFLPAQTKSYFCDELKESPLLSEINEAFTFKNGLVDTGKFMCDMELSDLEEIFSMEEVKKRLNILD